MLLRFKRRRYGYEAQKIDGSHITAYCDENDHKVFHLPYGESYIVAPIDKDVTL